jgi:hypothetical protein
MFQDIDRRYILYVQQNNKAIQQNRLDEVKNAQDHCVNFYAEKMDALQIDQHPVEDLTQKHMSIKKEVLAELHCFLNEDENHVLQNAEMVSFFFFFFFNLLLYRAYMIILFLTKSRLIKGNKKPSRYNNIIKGKDR